MVEMPAQVLRQSGDGRVALRRAFANRNGPTLIEVPVGALPSPWEFIFMPMIRGR